MKSRRSIVGTICMIFGAALVFGALFLFLYNQNEADAAEQAAAGVLPQLVQAVEERRADAAAESGSAALIYPEPTDTAMPEVIIDGCAYIGYVSIPVLGLELPVLSVCSEDALRLAPCRYVGTAKGGNLVLAGHNYVSHFGPISDLSAGDAVLFTDVNGAVFRYTVAETEILPLNAVADMTAGKFDLTLFTCTYSGQDRITVRCESVENG